MPARLVAVDHEGPGVATYWLELTDPEARRAYAFEAGQFNMLYLWGLGAVPISVSSDPAGSGPLAHTVAEAGSVTAGFPLLEMGDEVGLSGPFGRPWPVEEARGRTLVFVGGGVGLAPLRAAIEVALRERLAFERVVVLAGARAPEAMLYRRDLERWAARGDVEVALSADRVDGPWPHHVGLVTTLLDEFDLGGPHATAFVCGPEPMMRAVAAGLVDRGLAPEAVFLALERSMHCAQGRCGHCQLGPAFVCLDGPVFDHATIGPLLEVAEL